MGTTGQTDALSEYWHRTMRTELDSHGDDASATRDLFTQKCRGWRYRFGYPPCPDMSDQQTLFALVVHHPAAKYFNV